MAVRVTTLKGVDAGVYYTGELGRYYLDDGEPPGRWFGRQAETLGLSGELDPCRFLALMAGRRPGDGTVLGRRYGKTSARGYDVTFNAPKSVSLLRVFGDDTIRAEVEAAHHTAVTAVLGWLEERAHTRVTLDQATIVVDTQGLTVGLFEQHTSRTGDPHLHTHAVVIAKVRDEGGEWYALDARMLLKDQRTLSALYHVCLRAELTRRLGVEWNEPDNGIAELAGIDDEVLRRFSSRTDQFDRRLQDKLDRFRITFDREPTNRERWRLEREAVRDSRPAKHVSTKGTELSVVWREQLIAAGITPDELTRNVIGRHLEPTSITADDSVAIAMAARLELIETVSTWRSNDLVREIARRVPTNVTAPAADLLEWIDRTADAVSRSDVELVPTAAQDTSRRRDGRPVTESDVDRRFTTAGILAQEELIATWALDRLHTRGTPTVLEPGRLDRAQHEAAQAVAGTAALVLIVGPAGTGKTASLTAAVEHLTRAGRPVFGLAPSATAAAVLQQQTGTPSDTLDKVLYEHGRRYGPRPAYAFSAGTTIVVDEAGMISTPKLADLVQLAERNRWRVVLIGDPRQLPAVGRGGMFNHLVNSCGAVELDRVHRFAEAWERDASLGLRRGDSTVLDAYEHHDRIHDGTAIDMTRLALRAWAEHRVNGADVVMLATTNETVDKLNALAQMHRLVEGDVDGSSTAPGRACSICIGDDIVTRTNDRLLRTDRGAMVRNRATWTVTHIGSDGTIKAVGRDSTITLPAAYASTSVELAYAQTVHGAQGRTVDHALLFIDSHIDGRSLYVGITRGARSNHAYITIDSNRSGRDQLEAAIAGDWADTPAIDVRAALREPLANRLQLGFDAERSSSATTAAERLERVGQLHDRRERGIGISR